MAARVNFKALLARLCYIESYEKKVPYLGCRLPTSLPLSFQLVIILQVDHCQISPHSQNIFLFLLQENSRRVIGNHACKYIIDYYVIPQKSKCSEPPCVSFFLIDRKKWKTINDMVSGKRHEHKKEQRYFMQLKCFIGQDSHCVST